MINFKNMTDFNLAVLMLLQIIDIKGTIITNQFNIELKEANMDFRKELIHRRRMGSEYDNITKEVYVNVPHIRMKLLLQPTNDKTKGRNKMRICFGFYRNLEFEEILKKQGISITLIGKNGRVLSPIVVLEDEWDQDGNITNTFVFGDETFVVVEKKRQDLCFKAYGEYMFNVK